mmetsp:Transcript_25408/g.36166  ORF Transcript_25408/g.36166 Transcript_25408/m.36166 type:complete len:265 (+) Transcript_25408:222-1016(+)
MCTKTEKENDDNATAGVTKSAHGPNVLVANHPLLQSKLAVLRSSSTSPSTFRKVLTELTYLLGYEASASLQTKLVGVSVQSADGGDIVETSGVKLIDRVALIPIMRSGLGMTEAMLHLLPNAGVHHIGMYKDTASSRPIQYYNRLPRQCKADWVFILDPVIATSASVMSVIGIMKKWGVKNISVISAIASKSGLETLTKEHPDVQITIAAIDPGLTIDGIVLPGMGDAGDRLFDKSQTDQDDDDDEELLHPSKRKRSTTTTKDI